MKGYNMFGAFYEFIIDGIDNILTYFRILKESLQTMKFFFITIWNHKWWDYYFFQKLLDKQLEYLEVHYGSNSHFVGDTFTRGRIIILRRYLREWIECDEYGDFDYNKCNEKRKRFFKFLERNIEKFWD